MRFPLIALLVCTLAACRFEQSIPQTLELDTKSLIGDWKAADGNARVIISDLRFGRVRMLLKEGEQGMILDGHVIKLDNQRYLQSHIIAMFGPDKERKPLPQARWMVWKLNVSNKIAKLQAAKRIPFDGDTELAIVRSSARALADPTNFDPVREWKWVGSDKPAKL